MLAGIKEVGQVIKVIKSAMSDCSHIKADWEKLAKMAAIFDSPTSFAYHVGKDLIVNGKDIFREINTAIGDYKAQDWEGFGENVGEAAAKTILGHPHMNRFHKTQQFIAGLTMNSKVGNIDGCIKDLETIVKDVEIVVADFKKQSIQGAIDGVKEIVETVKEVKVAAGDCTHLKGKKRGGRHHRFHKSKYTHLIKAESFTKQIEAIVKDYDNNDWFAIGSQFSKIFEEQENKVKIAEVMQGIISKFGGHFNLEALLACVGEEDKAALILDAAFQQFEQAVSQKSIQDAIGGVILTIAGIKQAEQGIPACKAIDTTSWDFKGFQQANELMKNPLKYFKVEGEQVLVNGTPINSEIEEGLKMYKAASFEKVGEQLGSIM